MKVVLSWPCTPDHIQEKWFNLSHNLKPIFGCLKTDYINTALPCTALTVPVLENELEPFFVKLGHTSWGPEGRHVTSICSLITFLVSKGDSYRSFHRCSL